MKMLISALAATLVLSACGPAKVPGGTVEFKFAVSPSVKAMATDPLKGTVHGNVFLQEDVAIDGPRKGSEQFVPVDVEIDLRTVDTSTTTFVSKEIPEGKYTFLGFFDLDGNAGDAKNPDKGDPATLPTTNRFEISSGKQTKRLILFELLYNL